MVNADIAGAACDGMVRPGGNTQHTTNH